MRDPTPKTSNSIRTVGLPAPIVKGLIDYKEQFAPKKGDFIFRNDQSSTMPADSIGFYKLPGLVRRLAASV